MFKKEQRSHLLNIFQELRTYLFQQFEFFVNTYRLISAAVNEKAPKFLCGECSLLMTSLTSAVEQNRYLLCRFVRVSVAINYKSKRWARRRSTKTAENKRFKVKSSEIIKAKTILVRSCLLLIQKWKNKTLRVDYIVCIMLPESFSFVRWLQKSASI